MKIKLSQGKTALVDYIDYKYLSQWKWHFFDNRYAARKEHIYISPKKYGTKTVLMHREIMKLNSSQFVDHKNRNGLDNRRENLRMATRQQNQCNQKIRNDNMSGFKGVSWYKSRNKWLSEIHSNNKKIFIGYFDKLKDAATAYNKKAILLHGEFASLNPI